MPRASPALLPASIPSQHSQPAFPSHPECSGGCPGAPHVLLSCCWGFYLLSAAAFGIPPRAALKQKSSPRPGKETAQSLAGMSPDWSLAQHPAVGPKACCWPEGQGKNLQGAGGFSPQILGPRPICGDPCLLCPCHCRRGGKERKKNKTGSWCLLPETQHTGLSQNELSHWTCDLWGLPEYKYQSLRLCKSFFP